MNLIEFLYFRQKNNLAFHDRQTNMYNRNWWELFAKERKQNEELYLIMIDLNGLKTINDTKGHLYGDKYIESFAEKINKHFPNDDVCRLGGDEFLVITKIEPFDKIFALQNEFSHFSFGMSYKQKNDKLGQCLKKADLNMYRMKQWKKEKQIDFNKNL